MNIDLLSKMVKELILDSDSVVLPGFGVFIAEIVPATFSDKGYTLNPPYRRLHFRAKDVQDDALAALYASSNEVDIDIARNIVLDFTAGLKKVLQKNKVVIFPGLGRLRATKENNFFFVSDEELDIYPEGFGLEPISLKTHQETKEEVAAAVEDLADILNESNTSLPMAETTAETSQKVQEDTPEKVLSEPVPEDSEPAELPDDVAEVTELKGKKAWRTALIVAGVVIGVLALALLAFLVVAEACPDFMDSVLYSKEELEILNSWEKL